MVGLEPIIYLFFPSFFEDPVVPPKLDPCSQFGIHSLRYTGSQRMLANVISSSYDQRTVCRCNAQATYSQPRVYTRVLFVQIKLTWKSLTSRKCILFNDETAASDLSLLPTHVLSKQNGRGNHQPYLNGWFFVHCLRSLICASQYVRRGPNKYVNLSFGSFNKDVVKIDKTQFPGKLKRAV